MYSGIATRTVKRGVLAVSFGYLSQLFCTRSGSNYFVAGAISTTEDALSGQRARGSLRENGEGTFERYDEGGRTARRGSRVQRLERLRITP